MIDHIRSHLVWKIFLSYLLVFLVAGLVLTMILNLSIGTLFQRHVERMNIPLQLLMYGVRGMRLGDNVRMAMNEALIYSAIAAFIAAAIASLILSQRVTAPVNTMMHISQRLAKGDYSKRVPVNHLENNSNVDELDQLAMSFNQMAEQLEHTENMRRQLLADVSHELRTPLTAIKGSMEALMDGVLPSNRDTYQNVYQEADRLQRLVEDLQELSRVESGGLSLKLNEAHIEAIINQAVKQLQAPFDKKIIQLSKIIEKNLPRVNVDKDRILQVVINLLNNALQFSPQNGKVTITVKRMTKELSVSIQDDGIGIQKSDLTHIFERFYRADKSRSRAEGGGSGIGLTIAQSLVRAHGGRIWAESDGLGKGSIFHFTLPLLKSVD